MNDVRPELSDLTAFAAVATQKSFRKAAEELCVSPSTLSHRMRTLESRMGVRLLHRTTRSVAMTEAGAALLARLQPVFRELDATLAEVNDLQSGPRGSVRVNANLAGATAPPARSGAALPPSLDDEELMAQAGADGLGIAFVSERGVIQALKTRKLVVVLDEWCPRIPGLALYYPGHRQVPAGLRAFVEVLKETERGKA
jgi:DNA-binding transcriptional LysR family regulator